MSNISLSDKTADMSNDSNMTSDNVLECPEYSNETAFNIDMFAFWVEGILLCIIAVPGIVGNTLSSYILSGKTMRNSFNILLIALALFDNTYLFGSILESFRKRFLIYTDLHIILFPYFLYPIHMMAMTGSILMTVAIGLERYVAVHYPISYSRTTNDAHALKQRVANYLIPVTVVSVLFNITKFFEITYAYIPVLPANESNLIDDFPHVDNLTFMLESEEMEVYNSSIDFMEFNFTHFKVILNITEFRLNPDYSIYFNWTRFVTLGIIPFILLIFFNANIYADIRKRRKRKAARSATTRQCDSPSRAEFVLKEEMGRSKSLRKKFVATFKKKASDHHQVRHRSLTSRTTFLAIKIEADSGGKDQESEFIAGPTGFEGLTELKSQSENQTENVLVREVQGEKFVNTISVEVHQELGSFQVAPKSSPISSTPIDCSCGNSCACSLSESFEEHPEHLKTLTIACQTDLPNNGDRTEKRVSENRTRVNSKLTSMKGTTQFKSKDNLPQNPSSNKNEKRLNFENDNLASPLDRHHSHNVLKPIKANGTSITALSRTPSIYSNRGLSENDPGLNRKASNQPKNNREGNLAAIMMGYILVFLICHLPRLLLNIHELATIRNAMACSQVGQKPFEAWSLMVMHISHLLLVVNSSVNILIYSCLSSKFREEGSIVMKKIWRFICQGRNFQHNREVQIELTSILRKNSNVNSIKL